MKTLYLKIYNSILFLFSFIFFLCIVSCATKGETLNQEGINLANQKKYDDALEKFLNAEQQDPDRFENHLNIAQIYIVQKELEKALVYIDKALNLQPDVIEVYLMKAQVISLQGKDQKAKQLLDSLVVKYKNNSRLHDIFVSLGDNAFKNKNWDASIDMYKKALDVKSENANTYLALGRSLVFKEMASQFGNNNYGNFITTLNMHKANLDAAKSAFRKASYIDKDNLQAHLMLGMMAMQASNHKEAQVEINEVLRIDSKNLIALIAMSFNEYHLGNEQKSQQYLQIAKNAYPMAPEPFFLDAFLSVEQKKYGVAILQYVNMWEKYPHLRKDIVQNFKMNIATYSDWFVPLIQHKNSKIANFSLDLLKEITQKNLGQDITKWKSEIALQFPKKATKNY